jgi:hypothetical protein
VELIGEDESRQWPRQADGARSGQETRVCERHGGGGKSARARVRGAGGMSRPDRRMPYSDGARTFFARTNSSMYRYNTH